MNLEREKLKEKREKPPAGSFHFSLLSFHSRSGFTLIEMLISLSIFAVITGMVLSNLRLGAQGDELRISSQLVAASIRRAQTLAIAGQTVSYCQGGADDKKLCPNGTTDCSGSPCVTETPSAYGVHFSTGSGANRRIILFADIDGDRTFDASEEIKGENVSSGPFVAVQALTLGASTSVSDLDIVFVPPKPSVVFNDGATADGMATVTVRHANTQQEKRITINKVSGQVSAD
jgi:prepilin-type N-terminal cleavage/methylation domain-containing protein